MRTIVDEHTRACRSIDVARRQRSDDVLARRTARFVRHGPPSSLRSDNGPEFTATAVRSWLRRLGGTTRFIEPGSPWENGAVEACNGTRRDAGLTPEIFTTRTEAQVLIARWRRESNQGRPHSALGSRPPAPEALAIGLPHPTPWAVRRGPVLPSRVAQRSGAGQCGETVFDPESEEHTSFKMAVSRAWSATSRLRRAFSRSRALRRFA